MCEDVAISSWGINIAYWENKVKNYDSIRQYLSKLSYTEIFKE